MSPHFHEANDGFRLLGCDASFCMTGVGFRLSRRVMPMTREMGERGRGRRSRNQGAAGKDREPRDPVFKQALTPARLPLFGKWAVPFRSDSYWPNTVIVCNESVRACRDTTKTACVRSHVLMCTCIYFSYSPLITYWFWSTWSLRHKRQSDHTFVSVKQTTGEEMLLLNY